MDLDEASRRLKAHERELRRLGVDGLFIFGSVAPGQAAASSDVDIFVDYTKGAFGLYELMDVKDCATSLLGRPADVTTRDSLHSLLRHDIENAAVRVF